MKKIKIRIREIVITGFSIIILLLISTGAVAIYSINTAAYNSSRYIEAVDHARKVQIDLQRQLYLWNALVMRGDNYSLFNKYYHGFSYYSDRVSDSLFKLKMLSIELDLSTDSVKQMTDMHKELSSKCIGWIFDLQKNRFRNRQEALNNINGRDEESLDRMEEIVIMLEADSGKKISQVNSFYYNAALMSFILVSGILVIMSVYISWIVITAQEKLENKVKERTLDLAESSLKTLRANEELEEANKKLSKSEKRYRMIVEGSKNIIMILDENLKILSSNNALLRALKINQNEVMNLTLFDLIFTGNECMQAEKNVLYEQIEMFRRKKEPVTFRMNMKSLIDTEFFAMDIRLEFNDTGDKSEIICTASRDTVDPIIDYFISESCHYSIGNQLTTAHDVSHRITRNLPRYIGIRETEQLRISLREMIINSIEHGNLNITFDEKTEAQDKDKYFELLAERQRNPVLSEKKVNIDYSINPERVIYRITDSGKGFNHKKYLHDINSGCNQSGLSHGRGIIMTKAVFDEVRYNIKGSQVLLMKKFSAAPLADPHD